MSDNEQKSAQTRRSSHLSDVPSEKLSLREAQKRLTRERLITAGEAEFRIRGYNETTAENIATSAGTSRATFYVYFKSKAEVVLELMQRSAPDVLSAYSDLDAITKPTPKNVRAWLRTTMALWDTRRNDFTIMEQALANDDAVTDLWISTLANTYRVMPRTFGRLTDAKDHERARLHLLTLQSALERMMYFAVIRRRPVKMDLLLDTLTVQWLAFLESTFPDHDKS
ncbi:TetR/AcrR family transcriptional regulator [Paeniglutamicibacter sp.]|uniref:TetR/AcrR family transcriptional regulator n=1 Tax=Paeniglutamicibacter sp. TaxID=1934391 RepID=UPI00398A38B2